MKTTINPYLTFEGTCEEAFNFYKSAFGGEFSYLGRFNEMPPQEGITFPEEMGNRIMHVSLPVGEHFILMGSDTGGEQSPKLITGNNISISISPETSKEADILYQKLSDRGQIIMPMAQTFWGAYFGMFTDKFGINWMINVEAKPQK